MNNPTAAEQTGAPRYQGWQPEKAGFLGGLSLVGFCFVAAAVVVVLVPVYRRSWHTLWLAAPAAAMLLALACVRISGLSAEEWLTRVVRHGWNVARRRHTFASGVFAPAHADDPTQKQPMELPGTLACLRILHAPTGTGSTVAVVHDPLANTYTAVLRVRPPGLALADTTTQNHRVASWGGVLAGLCVEDGPLVRVGVCGRSLPDDGTALRAWTETHTVADAPPQATRVLTELLDGAGPSANTRATFLTLTLDATRARAKIRAAGGGDLGACAVLLREVAALRPAITAAELRIEEILGPRELAAVIRTAYDPHATEPLAARCSHPDREGLPAGVDPALAGPAAAASGWHDYRHDGAWTITYQVRDWPRAGVYASVLQPLMKPTPHARRCFTLLVEPLAPGRAERELSRDRTKRQTLIGLRRRTGRVDSPDELTQLTRAEAQDEARAAGHGICRFTALVAVTVTNPDQLAAACAELEADAAMSRIELRRLWGAQDAGFAAACLPLGQGLPARRFAL